MNRQRWFSSLLSEDETESMMRLDLWAISRIDDETKDNFSFLLILAKLMKTSLFKQGFDFSSKDEIGRRKRDGQRLLIAREREVAWKIEILVGEM